MPPRDPSDPATLPTLFPESCRLEPAALLQCNREGSQPCFRTIVTAAAPLSAQSLGRGVRLGLAPAHDRVAQRAGRLPRRAAEALEIRRARHQNSAIRTPDAPHDPQRLAGDSGLMTASDHVTDSASKQAGRTDPDATGYSSAARAVTRGLCYSNQPIPRTSHRVIYLTHFSF